MSKINYTKGDATSPQGEGKKVICHICNNLGGWGAGFVLALSKKWSEPEQQYRALASAADGYQLGACQVVGVEDHLMVANLIAQDGTITRTANNVLLPPVHYTALDIALGTLADYAEKTGSSVHMPRMGTGLAGGRWSVIETLINDRLIARGIEVTVYDFE